MKTNAGQSFGFPLLGNLTTERGTAAINRNRRNEIARAHRASVPKSWLSTLAAILRRTFIGLNAGLTELYRLGEQSALVAERRESSSVSLQSGEISNVTKLHRASRIEVRSGIVWLTGDPADGDVILSAGESFELKGDWVYVVQALGEATIVVWH